MSRDPQLDEAIGTIDGVNDVFETPEAYIPGSVHVYINGLLTQRSDPTDGLTELGGKEVRLHYTPRVGDTVHLYYYTGPATGHPFPIPPKAVATIVLEPIPAAAIDLVPAPDHAEGPAETESPSGLAINLEPTGVAAIDLVPIPLSSEEV